MQLASIRDFKAHLARYLRLVESGDPVAVTRHGKPIAVVMRPSGRRSVPEKLPEAVWWEAALRSGEMLPAESRAHSPRASRKLAALGRAALRRFLRERRS